MLLNYALNYPNAKYGSAQAMHASMLTLMLIILFNQMIAVDMWYFYP